MHNEISVAIFIILLLGIVILFVFFLFLRIFFPLNWYIWMLKIRIFDTIGRHFGFYYSSKRVSAANKLGTLGGEKAVKALIDALSDEDGEVRRSVDVALEKLNISDKELFEGYLNALKSRSSSARCSAAKKLGTLGDKSAVKPLIDALSDQEVRGAVVIALGTLGDKSAVEPLIKMLSDLNRYARYVRGDVVIALGTLGDKSAVKPLIDALSDYPEVHRAVIRALGTLEDKKALGTLGDKSVVEPLIKMLSDRNRYVRMDVVWALGTLGGKEAVKPLIDALSDDDRDVRMAVDVALEKLNISDKELFEGYLNALKSRSSDARIFAAEKLGTLGDKRAVKPLIDALSDEYGEVRRVIVEAFETLGDKSAVEPMIKMLSDSDWDVCKSAFGALKKLEISKEKLTEVYLKELNNSRSYVRNLAAEELGKLRVKRAINPLLNMLDDSYDLKSASLHRYQYMLDEDEYLKSAAFALGEIGDTIALPKLRGVLAFIPPTHQVDISDDPIYYPELVTKDNPFYLAIKSVITKLEKKIEYIPPDVKEWKLIVPPIIRRFKVCSKETTLFQLSERSWIWKFGVENRKKDKILAKIKSIKKKSKKLLKILKKKGILGNKKVVSIYSHGSYFWLDEPNDIDIFIVVAGTMEYTYISTKIFSKKIYEDVFQRNIKFNIELIGLDTLKENVEKKEEKATWSSNVERRRALLLYGSVLIGGVDLYLNSKPPIENFLVLRNDLIRDSKQAIWFDIKNNIAKMQAKKRWRYLEASCLEKMFDIEPIAINEL